MIEKIVQLDYAVLDFIRAHIATPFLDKAAIFVSLLGGVVLWAVIGGLLLLKKHWRSVGLQVLVSVAAGVILSELVLKLVFVRERPFLLENIPLIVDIPSGYSFPSTHTLQSFAAAVSLLRINKACGISALIFAAMVGFSRMYLYVHFPSDVMTAAVLGAALGLFFTWLFKYIKRRKSNKWKLS